MKLNIKRSQLLELLTIGNKAISSKIIIPALQGIKFDINNNTITVVSSSNSIHIKNVIDTEEYMNFESNFVFIVNAKIFLDIIKKIDSEIITLSLFENTLIIITTDSEFKLNTYNKTSYPEITFLPGNFEHSFDATVVKEGIQSVNYATYRNDTNSVLSGIRIQNMNSKLNIVATDSFRFASYNNDTLCEDASVVLSTIITSIISLINIGEGTRIKVTSDFEKELVMIQIEGLTIMSGIIHGTYPNIQNYVDNSYESSFTVNKTKFLKLLERASLFTVREEGDVTFKFLPKKIIIQTDNPLIGDCSEQLEITEATINVDSIMTNIYNVIDAVKKIEDGKIKLSLNSFDQPFNLKGETSSTDHYIMPIIKK